MITIDLSKQQELFAHSKAIRQINFIVNLNGEGNSTIFFIIDEAKEIVLHFSQGTVKVLCKSSHELATACSTVYLCFNIISI